MELSNIVIIILLLTAIIVWLISINISRSCPQVIQPQPQIIYRFKPDLDLQFDTTNFPTEIYSQMFNGPNTTIGGYSLENGRSTLTSVNDQNNKGGTISPKIFNNGLN